MEAGYKANERNVKNKARKLTQQLAPYIADQLKKYASSVEMGILGLQVVGELAQSDPSGAVRLNAAKELLSRAIPEEPKESKVTHVHETKQLSNAELDDKIRQLADKLFIDAKDVTDGIQVGQAEAKAEEEVKAEVVVLEAKG